MDGQHQQQLYFRFNTRECKFWKPKTGWNASFFEKDKIRCTSYYYQFLKNHNETDAEIMALKKAFEEKYHLRY